LQVCKKRNFYFEYPTILVELRVAIKNPSTRMTSKGTTNYIEENISPRILEKLEAGAFRSLCSHLRERSDEVQNIDLMTVSGFCRNCLAKWMVMEARKLSQGESEAGIRNALNSLGYDEAAKYIYGCDYEIWKKQHSKKATEEQMKKYHESTPIHSVFDKNVLEKRVEEFNFTEKKLDLRSNVCCQDVENEKANVIDATMQPLESLSFIPPGPPEGGISFTASIITISDRAFRNEYEFGDLSGPALQKAILECVDQLSRLYDRRVSCTIKSTHIVPDDKESIQSILRSCASGNDANSDLSGTDMTPKGVDLILTTGGTGCSPRDVTPEATTSVLDRECHGLIPFIMTACMTKQPLAALSRGTAGILGSTMICNLPGNPRSIDEIIPILLPVVIHAISELQR
jgi:molybdopterin adenylyltransferase